MPNHVAPGEKLVKTFATSVQVSIAGEAGLLVALSSSPFICCFRLFCGKLLGGIPKDIYVYIHICMCVYTHCI